MTNRTREIHKAQLRKQDIQENTISSLSNRLDLPNLKPGKKKFFCDRGWLNNEKDLDYSWMVNISTSSNGSCWIFTIKYNATASTGYREGFNNKKEYVQGIFNTNDDGTIKDFFLKYKPTEFKDRIKEYTPYDFINSNLEFSLDLVEYKYLIFTVNNGITPAITNPNSKNWEPWESEIFTIGKRLVKKVEINELKNIFQ